MAVWADNMVAWFVAHRRPMPWRDQPSPYRVWISEMMLQQTQVATVIPYFERFIARFPTVKHLAAADVQEVLKLWEGLGYYSRARNLWKAARHVVDAEDGTLPETAAAWQRLPGVGAYTAAAVASIAQGEAIPSIDGNVLRVFTRFWGIEDNIALPTTRETIAKRLTPHIRRADPSLFNQAMMELGALVCRPRSPACETCPLTSRCVARRRGLTARLPVKTRTGTVPHHTMAVGLVHRRKRILLCRRHDAGLLGGLWEFPGGRRRGREPLAATAAREVAAQTGVTVAVQHKQGRVTHAFSHFKVTLHVFECKAVRGRTQATAHAELRWVTPAEIKALPLSAAQRKIAEWL